MRIPVDALQPATLQGLLEEFVTRDGTDYGEHEASLEQKVDAVRAQLKSGTAVIVYDGESESCSVMLTRDAPPA